MIKLEHVVLASPEQMEFIIEGMRNIDCSWEKSDSETWSHAFNNDCRFANERVCDNDLDNFRVGKNDYALMQLSANKCLNSVDNRKFMRMMPVYVRITAPLYWWTEFDTYLGKDAVESSCLVLQNFREKEFTLEDFSCEHLTSGPMMLMKVVIDNLNDIREWYLKYDSIRDDIYKDKIKFNDGITCKKDIWWQMIQLLPSSYNQTRNVMLNYEILANIYKISGNFTFDEWSEFRKWIESLPYSELICCNGDVMTPNEQRKTMGLEPIKETGSESLKMRKGDTKKYDEASCKSLNRIAAAADASCSDNCDMECPYVLKED